MAAAGDNLEFGVYIPQVALDFGQLLERALRCERLGFGSFWLFDHLYTPGLPDQPALEGWTLATALLARTARLRVGHLVLDNNLRHPALVARMAATLDVISGGRLDLGMGSGSYAAEHRQGGFPWGSLAERSERLAEGLEVITRMLGGSPVSFEGRHYRLAELPSLPRPLQRPRPPIVVGGVGERHTLPLVARYADVWNVPTYGLGVWQERVPALEACCERIGRDPGTIRRSLEAVLVLAPDEPSLRDARARYERRYQGPGWGLAEGGFVGTPSRIVDRIGELADAGMSHFVFFVADRGEGSMLELFAQEVMAQVARA
ncbi:MAG TPA: LLM class flavin-dependent oxidoreductase [Acidimicrobiales bacterium]|nr:LLM class flavin-dependent oxidoreductase [Acidimicrobiales bacterium]